MHHLRFINTELLDKTIQIGCGFGRLYLNDEIILPKEGETLSVEDTPLQWYKYKG